MYTVWDLDVLLGSIGDEGLVIGDLGLDVEDSVGGLVGHGFVAPMGAVEVHGVVYNYHFGWGDPLYLPL